VGKDLHSLIRLNDWQVDEKRRVLAELFAAAEALEAKARKLEQDLINEQKVAAESPAEAGLLYGYYAKAVIDRREALAVAIAEAERQVIEARDLLREAYRELKKYEVAQEHRDTREASENGRREQIQLDDVGIQGFIRRKMRKPS